MASSDSPRRTGDPAETTGEIVGLSLPDVIQINHHNRFSGCIAIESQAGNGLLFFRDGEIIHAEQGSRVGEDAFCDVLEWPPGKFRLQPNVATTRTTIQKGSQHLLLDAHRALDERRAGRKPPPPPSPGPAAGPTRSSEVIERLRRIPGVAYAALHGKDGSQVGDDSYQAEVLSGQAVFLSMLGNQLGAVFQAGTVISAVVHGTTNHLVLFSTKSHFLSVLVQGGTQAGAVENEVRRVLAPPR
jgi:hypothetical protein